MPEQNRSRAMFRGMAILSKSSSECVEALNAVPTRKSWSPSRVGNILLWHRAEGETCNGNRSDHLGGNRRNDPMQLFFLRRMQI